MRLLSEHGKGTEVTEWSLCELQSLLASPLLPRTEKPRKVT